MLHLKVLEEADLIVARREGRERWNHLNALPIKQIHDRWISQYAGHAISILDPEHAGTNREREDARGIHDPARAEPR